MERRLDCADSPAFPGKPAQENSMRRSIIVYTGVILLGFIMLLNGLAIYKPVH